MHNPFKTLVVSMSLVHRLRVLLAQPLSFKDKLHNPFESGEPALVEDIIESDAPSPEEVAASHEQAEKLEAAMLLLTKKQQFVLDQMYYKGLNYESIATQLHTTRQAVQQLHDRAIKQLRKHLLKEIRG